MINRQRRSQGAFFRIIVGSRPGCTVKPVHRRRPGPGPAEHIVRCRIDHGTRLVCILLLPQVHIDAADGGGRLAVHLVPGHAGRRRSVEGRFRRVIVGGLHRLVGAEVPCLFELDILIEYLFKPVNGEAHHILAGVRHLIPQVVALLVPVGEKIKAGVAFRGLRALDAHGVQGPVAVPCHRHILCGHIAFGCAGRRFCPQRRGQFLRSQRKIRAHLFSLGLFRRYLPGFRQRIFRLDFVLFFYTLFLKPVRVRIRHGSGGARTGIADHGDAVHVQQVHRHPGAYRSVGTGAAQGQPSHYVGHRGAAVGAHGKGSRCLDRGFIVQQHQRVDAPCKQAQGSRGAQVLIRLAGAEDDAGLDHFVFGVKGNVAAVLSGCICRQGHIFPGQDQAVADKILYRHGSPRSVAVAFRHGEKFPAVAGGRHYIRICQGIHINIFPGGNIRLFPQGHDTLVVQLSDVDRGRHIQISGAAVLGIHHVAAHIVVGIAARAHYVGQILDHLFCFTAQLGNVLPFVFQEVLQRITEIPEGSPVCLRFEFSVHQLLHLHGIGFQVGQLRELVAEIF